MQGVHIFNPDHDLALANNDVNFSSPHSAQQLGTDLSCLPLWYAPEGSVILSQSTEKEWLEALKSIFPQLSTLKITKTFKRGDAITCYPWGWNKVVLKKLLKLKNDSNNNIASAVGEAIELLSPNQLYIEKIKDLSHRKFAIEAHRFIINKLANENLLGTTATEMENCELLFQHINSSAPCVLKAPWSSSGKGLRWLRNGLTQSHEGWCKNTIIKQGSLIYEPIYAVKQNFAMTFVCQQKQTIYKGFSFFETEVGIYRSNFLMQQSKIQEKLNTLGLDNSLIEKVKQTLIAFFDTEVAPFYEGVLGVDMFIFEKEGHTLLHPCVEINVRTTMGYVSQCVFENFVYHTSVGKYRIDHFDNNEDLQKNHEQKTLEMPLKIKNNKIVSGYLSLVPINNNSLYRASIEIF